MSAKLRILIVDDDRRMVKTLADIFRVKGYEADMAYSGSEALKKLAEDRFDCVLSDIKMPEVNGVELYRVIKAGQPDMPVVLMTAYFDDKLVREGLEEGAIAVLTKPLDMNKLLGFFSTLCKKRSVIILDNDLQFWEGLRKTLQSRGFSVTQVTDPQGVMETLKQDEQVVLLDMGFDSAAGLEILEKQYPRLPVVLVTGCREERTQAIEADPKINAYACLYKPFEIEELLKVLNKIRHKELGRILGRPLEGAP